MDPMWVAAVASLIADDSIYYVGSKKRNVKKPKRVHEFWVSPFLQKKSNPECNTFYKLQLELSLDDDKALFKRLLRMDEETYMYLLELVSPLIEKQNTSMRKAHSCAEKLAATLRFLASGHNQSELMLQYRLSRQSIGRFIPYVCWSIFEVLKDEYMMTPKEPWEWQQVADEFNCRWNFPNCLGALDGKHITVIAPPNTGSTYYNYKHQFSVVMMALLVNANYEFLYIDIGTEGRVADGGVWRDCSLGIKIRDDKAGVPIGQNLPGSDESTPMVIVADDAFPLGRNLMKPYSRRNMEHDERVFNYRLSRARRVSENAFGILANRFRVFHTKINMDPDNIIYVVLAAAALHNMLRRRCGKAYMCPGTVDHEDCNYEIQPGEWRKDPPLQPVVKCSIRNAAKYHKAIRHTLKEYFVSNAGSVPWQDYAIYRS